MEVKIENEQIYLLVFVVFDYTQTLAVRPLQKHNESGR